MKNVILRLKSSQKVKKTNYLLIIFFLFLYCFSIPSFGSRGTWNYLVYILMFLLGLLVVIYVFLFKKISLNKWFIPIPFFALFSLVGTILYSHEYRSFLTLVLLAGSFFVIYFALSIVNNKQIVLGCLTIGLFVFNCYYIYVYRDAFIHIKDTIANDVRLGFYFDNPNGVAAFAIIGYIMSLYGLLFTRRTYKWLYLIPLLTSLLVGVSTGSRTFIVAFFIITIVITLFRFRKHIITYFLVISLFVSVVVIMFSLPIMSSLRDRFISAFTTFFTDSAKTDISAVSRVVWLDYGFYLGNKYLLTGTGPYGFGIMSGVGTYTHSNFSEVWCDFGLFGFILFYLPMLICVILSIKNNNQNKSFIISVFFYYILISFSNVFYYTKFYYFNIAFMYYLTFNDSQEFTALSKHKTPSLKKIMITCDGMDSGGTEKVISILANQFSSFGYEVMIVGVSTHKTSSFYKLNSNVKYITLHHGDDKQIIFFRRIFLLRKIFKKYRPDIILSFLPHINIYTYYSSIGLKIPFIVSERNNPVVDPKGFILRKLKKLVFSQSDGVVFQTNSVGRYYKNSVRKKSTVIFNPIDPNVLVYRSNKNKKDIVLCVGRFTKQKNIKFLIDGFSIFVKSHCSFILRLYGNGELREELVEYAKAKNVLDKIEFKDTNSKWQNIEKDDAMFVLPSLYEGMPNALLEAIAVGIPSISTDCPIGGPRDIIKNGINGYLVEINNVDQLVKQMESIVNQTLIWDYDEFNSRFDAKKIALEWVAYIDLVLERCYKL